MKRLTAILFGLLAVCATVEAHEITFGQLDIRMEASTTAIEVKVPDLALIQEEPSSLPAGSTADMLSEPLSPEINAAISQLVIERLKISADGAPVLLTVTGVTAAGADIDVTLSAPPLSGDLAVDANLFPTDPLHKVFANVYRSQELLGQYALDQHNPTFTADGLPLPLMDVVGTFILEGIHHIFIGPDHILFVIALILLGGPLWSQLKIVTAFTVAHSITLVLATLDIVRLPSQLIESVIAVSIIVVGLHDLWQLQRGERVSRRPDVRILFAFAFGLMHGFGFASVLAELALPQEALAWSLAAFNIGVEVGQVAIVIVAAPVILLISRYAPRMVARAVLSAGAGLVVFMGSVWLWERLAG